MTSKAPRIVLIALGVVALLIGALWTGQGAGLIGGSFMTGSSTWLAIGLGSLVLGIFLLWLALRRPGGVRG